MIALSMLPRAIAYSDLHLDEGSADTVLNEVLPGILRLANEFKCKMIVCLGDFHHVRYRVNVRLQNAVNDHFRQCADAGIEYVILPGNHDQIDAAGNNALEVFNNCPNVTVISEPMVAYQAVWMPYRPAREDVIAHIRRLAGPNLHTLFLHYGVRGALQNSTVVDVDGVEPSVFEEMGFKSVVCGHYHKRQTLGKGLVQYLGSPYQTRADEAGQQKGVYLYEETGVFQFMPQEWGKRFVRLEVGNLEELKAALNNVTARDDVRVTLAPNISMEAAHHVFSHRGHKCFTLTPQVKDFTQRLEVPDNAGLQEYARAYLDSQNMSPEQHQAHWDAFQTVTRMADPVRGGGVL